ncbi:MAG: DUF4333 domain-containing protein [Thermoleophilaceae bacterium]
MARRFPLVAALLLVAPAVGCGDQTQTVDAAQIEKQIERSLSSATAMVTSVACPGDVESKTGAKFTCDAKLEGGGSAKVVVTETQAPDRFSYTFKPGTVKLAGESVDAALERELAASGVSGAKVECPDPVTVKTGTTVTCPVQGAGGGVGRVRFEFSDSSGSIDESSVETGS